MALLKKGLTGTRPVQGLKAEKKTIIIMLLTMKINGNDDNSDEDDG